MTFHPRSRLRETQNIIVNEIKSNPFKLIVSGMGSGKTAATLTAIRDLLDSVDINHVLVVGPLRVARDVWPDEIEAWEHTRLMSYAVAVGTPDERRAAIDRKAEITIINRENLVGLAKHLGTIKNWHYDCVVIDESSMFKEGAARTKRTKVKVKVGETWQVFVGDEAIESLAQLDEPQAVEWAELLSGLLGGTLEPRMTGIIQETRVRPGGNMTRFGVLSTARQKIKRIYELTGTPAPNGVEDLWGQIYLLDQGAALGRSKHQFRTRYFDKDPYREHTYTLKDGAESEIMRRVQHLMVSLPPEKLVPDPVHIPIRVTLPPKTMKEYRDFEKTLVSETYDVEAVSKGVLANKLLQFANGSMYRGDGSIAKVHDCKLKALDALVDEAAGENLLVFYGFKFDLTEIRKKYPHAVVLNEEPNAVRDWNAGKIKMLLAHPASCAHGLNMQFGGHICVWYGLTWSLEFWLQANTRLPRPGQENIVAIYALIAENTYDENAMDTLAQNDVTQQQLVDSVLYRLRDS